jgi:hypothetical protein
MLDTNDKRIAVKNGSNFTAAVLSFHLEFCVREYKN